MKTPMKTPSVGPPPPPIPQNPVVGTSPTDNGILGRSGTGVGVWGESLGAGGRTISIAPPSDGVFGHGLNGVHGTSESNQGSGVFGENTRGGDGVLGIGAHNGVHGKSASSGDSGVWGENTGSGAGVSGNSANGDGVFGTGAHNGVHGKSASSGDSGVWGENTGSGAGVSGNSANGDGVFGTGAHNGVHGQSASSSDSGVWADNTGAGYGLAGTSAGGVGIYGRGGTLAGQFDGNVEINGGTLTIASGGDIMFGDFAEEFDVADPDVEPGTVVVLDQNGALRRSSEPYDSKVAGIVSGAGEYRSAVVLHQKQSGRRMAIALFGKVCCKVDAEQSPIAVGDLLTTSPTPGLAMKATDARRAFGAVIGKALRPLKKGQGLIPILVALQ
jgi:hypothetical protein